MKAFRLKEGLQLGTATAATQIEGGGDGHSWSDWAAKGHVQDQTTPLRATDHWHRWPEDFALMQKMGIQVYRFGVEWSRIEPREGHFDEAALAHYAAQLRELKRLGIRPLLTLHHFTNPLWFEKKGAFLALDHEAVFLRFVAKVVTYMGDLVSEYITINEPNVYAVFGYLYGQWPPGQKSLRQTLRTLRNLASCHVKAYELIHRLRREQGHADTKVSFAHHMRVFAPANAKNPWHRSWAGMLSWAFQDALAKACLTGRFRFPLWPRRGIRKGRYYDFLGINYYTRSSVRGPSDATRKGAPVNDLGWEIYPQGLTECARRLWQRYPASIYITENGTCDNADRFRSRYLCEHLRAICESDLPIERYYHWCFCDNFEWLEGESARFGLVHVDYSSQERTVKQSGRVYQRILQEGGVSEALAQEVRRQRYARGGPA